MAIHVSGRVVEVHGMLVTVRLDGSEGTRVRARPPRDRVTPVIGDLCEIECAVDALEALTPRTECRVIALAPRVRVFERLGVPRQVVAANVDRIVIVSAVDPAPRPGLIDRMWVALGDPTVEVLLVVNKCDLGAADAVASLADHAAAGAVVLGTSTRTGEGIDALRERVSCGVSLLVGHSGVGKSSLVNALVPGAALSTGDVDAWGKGRHTTTVATCHAVGEALVVDTPGVRAFPIESLSDEEAAMRFPGLEALAQECHMSDCLHLTEPGCAVLDSKAPEIVRHHARWLALLESLRAERSERRRPVRGRR